MKRSFLFLLVVCWTAVLAGPTYCGPLSLQGFISMPTGDFGDDSGEEAGLAKTGFGVGAEFKLPVGTQRLSWLFSTHLLVNSVDTDVIEAEMPGGSVDASSWVNIPLMAGIRVENVASPQIGMYGVGLVGLNFARSPQLDMSGPIDGYDAQFKQESGSATSFGFEVGGGVLIADKFDVSLRYLNLGKPEFTVEVQGTVDGETVVTEGEFEQSISMFLISAGFAF